MSISKRPNLDVLHERVCFKYNLLFAIALLLISIIDTGSGVIPFERAASPPRLTGFEIVALITLLPFLVVLAIAVKCIAERVVFVLFVLNVVFDLATRGVASFPFKNAVLVRHYYALSLTLGICTTAAILFALVVARIKQHRPRIGS